MQRCPQSIPGHQVLSLPSLAMGLSLSDRSAFSISISQYLLALVSSRPLAYSRPMTQLLASSRRGVEVRLVRCPNRRVFVLLACDRYEHVAFIPRQRSTLTVGQSGQSQNVLSLGIKTPSQGLAERGKEICQEIRKDPIKPLSSVHV